MNQPRRPSPAVARRRQLVALIAGVFLLALIVWGVREAWVFFTSDDEANGDTEHSDTEQDGTEQDNGDQDSTDQNQDPDEQQGEAGAGEDESDATSEDDEPGASDADEPEAPEGYCDPSDIEVRASTRDESYDLNEAPLLVMEIENTGNEECTLDVGTAEQSWQIIHGGDEVFSINQCDITRESYEIELEPGQSENAQFSWPRSDSGVDCAEPAELPGGEYELTVGISGITSSPHVFEMAGTSE